MKKIITSATLFAALAASAATPTEIIDWYKSQVQPPRPNFPISAICKQIEKNLEERKNNVLVVSRNGWSLAESQAALDECNNQKFAGATPSQLRNLIKEESRRCDGLRNKANQNWNALALAMGRKADADAAYAKCDSELQVFLSEKRKAIETYEAEKTQKAANEKASQEAVLATTELPNLPLSYYNAEQAKAYMFSAKAITVESVVSRSAFKPFPNSGPTAYTSTWTLNVLAPRDIYAHALSINCYQTVAGKEQHLNVFVAKNSNNFVGQLNQGDNQIQVQTVFVDDATFPVRDLIERVRCSANNGVHPSQFKVRLDR